MSLLYSLIKNIVRDLKRVAEIYQMPLISFQTIFVEATRINVDS